MSHDVLLQADLQSLAGQNINALLLGGLILRTNFKIINARSQPELLQRGSGSCVCIVQVDFGIFIGALQFDLPLVRLGNQIDWRSEELIADPGIVKERREVSGPNRTRIIAVPSAYRNRSEANAC